MRDALVRAHAATRRIVTAVCSCGWSGELGATAKCPSCEAPESARITRVRGDMLELLSSAQTRAIAHVALGKCPLLCRSLLKLRMIRADGKYTAPGRKPSYDLTEQGAIVLAAYRRMQAAARERAAIAGMTAARHADLPEAP